MRKCTKDDQFGQILTSFDSAFTQTAHKISLYGTCIFVKTASLYYTHVCTCTCKRTMEIQHSRIHPKLFYHGGKKATPEKSHIKYQWDKMRSFISCTNTIWIIINICLWKIHIYPIYLGSLQFTVKSLKRRRKQLKMEFLIIKSAIGVPQVSPISTWAYSTQCLYMEGIIIHWDHFPLEIGCAYQVRPDEFRLLRGSDRLDHTGKQIPYISSLNL